MYFRRIKITEFAKELNCFLEILKISNIIAFIATGLAFYYCTHTHTQKKKKEKKRKKERKKEKKERKEVPEYIEKKSNCSGLGISL